jgi:hypothetical protein
VKKRPAGQLALDLPTTPGRCACPRRDAKDCADTRYGGSRLERLESGREADPCTCACHEPTEVDDDPLPW